MITHILPSITKIIKILICKWWFCHLLITFVNRPDLDILVFLWKNDFWIKSRWQACKITQRAKRWRYLTSEFLIFTILNEFSLKFEHDFDKTFLLLSLDLFPFKFIVDFKCFLIACWVIFHAFVVFGFFSKMSFFIYM